jgi:RNA polymerase subunit RPABC4/transcription elongation factor Spt4
MAAIPTILQILVAFLGAYFIALWFSMIIWTYYDIRARSQDLYVHIFATALVVVFNVFGLLLYFILRPRETLAEAYERSLEEETLLQEIEERQSCPNCRQRVSPDFMFCPYCHTELKHRCARCDRLLLLRWDLCPYCGNAAVPAPRATTGNETQPVPAIGAPASAAAFRR